MTTIKELEEMLDKPKELSKIQQYVRSIRTEYDLTSKLPTTSQLSEAYQETIFIIPKWLAIELFHFRLIAINICKKHKDVDLYEASAKEMQSVFFEITGVIVDGKELLEITLSYDLVWNSENSIVGCATRDIDPELLVIDKS